MKPAPDRKAAGRDDVVTACCDALLRSADDEVAALADLEAAYTAAAKGKDERRASILAGAAVCIIQPSWGDLTSLPLWCERVRSVRTAPEDATGRLLYLGARMHLENVLPERPGAGDSLAGHAVQLKRALIASLVSAPAEIVAVAAEPLLDYYGQAGESAALEEVAAMASGAVQRAEPRLASRSLFWLGNSLRLVDAAAAAKQAFDAARAISEDTGWYWIRVQLLRAAARPAMETRDRPRIDAILAEFKSLLRPERPLDWGDFHHLRGWDALLANDARAALQHYRLAVECAQRGALPPHMAAVWRGGEAASLVLLGRADEGAEIYNANRVYETERGARAQQASVSFALAWHARGKGADDYVAHLREGFAAAREFELYNVFRALPGIVAQLCSDALDEDIEPPFVRKLVAMRRLAPPPDAGEAWPWPVRVSCFGEFSLALGDKPLEFPGKAQNKPLELVKVLAANDNRPLPVARLMELLWPDSEPDAARKAFDAALIRLRKLIDSNEAFVLDGGQFGIDAKSVWSDVGQLNAMVAQADAARGEGIATARLVKIAMGLPRLYRAAFLIHEAPSPWVLEARERLKNRFLRAVEQVGGELEARQLALEAIRLYDRATEVEPLAESLYRRLMLAHVAQGSPAEAMRVYRRCREMLSILLSMAPSLETQAIVERINRAHP